MAVTLAVYIVGKVSGGHINPAVTLAQCVLGNFPWIELPFYAFAQIAGGFFSSVILFAVYSDMDKTDSTAGIFATYPRDNISLIQAFSDEIFGTMLLVLCIEAINDNNNSKPPSGFEPFFAGITVFTIGSSYGVNTGYAINPARDLGPRLFTQIAGWDNSFQRGNNKFDYYFWIPIVGPLIGAIAGALLYKYVIGAHLAAIPPKYHEKNSEMKMKETEEGSLLGGGDAPNNSHA